MKIERKKNAARNVVFGVIQRLYNMVMPFIMRTVMIYLMGVEYLGLNSLFTSILQVLNLAELGVGSAMVFSMYKPIAEDDDDLFRGNPRRAQRCRLRHQRHQGRHYLVAVMTE